MSLVKPPIKKNSSQLHTILLTPQIEKQTAKRCTRVTATANEIGIDQMMILLVYINYNYCRYAYNMSPPLQILICETMECID